MWEYEKEKFYKPQVIPDPKTNEITNSFKFVCIVQALLLLPIYLIPKAKYLSPHHTIPSPSPTPHLSSLSL